MQKEIDDKNSLISRLQDSKEIKGQTQKTASPKKEQSSKVDQLKNNQIAKQDSYNQKVKDDSHVKEDEQDEQDEQDGQDDNAYNDDNEDHDDHEEYVEDYEDDEKDQVDQQDPNIIEDDEHDDEEDNKDKEFKGELKAIISDIEVEPLFDKLKLWLQRNNIKYNSMGQALPSEITIMKLEHKLKSIGFKDAEERLNIWRYIIEPRNEKMVEFNENREISKEKAENILKSKIEDYKTYEFEDVFQKRINEKIGRFKETVKDALECEDLDGTGFIAANSLKGWFHAMDISLDADLIDYLVYISGVTDKVGNSKGLMIEYNKILELLEKPATQNAGGVQPSNNTANNEDDKHDYSDDYGNDFEEIAKHDKPKESTSEPKETNENNQEYRAEGEGDELDQEIDDEEMISIAENWLIRIAEELLNKKVTIRQLYRDDIIDEEIEGEKIELLLPLSFLEGLKRLEINDFSQLEIAWLMNVLAKPQLENTILLDELIDIMENLGIQDEGAEQSTAKK